MSEEHSWRDGGYLAWLKAAKGLEYLQEGLEDFVEDGINGHHDILLQTIGITESFTCKSCTIDNILPEHPGGICPQQHKSKCLCTKRKANRRLCPVAICSKMYDCIVCDHFFTDPLWSNTDPRKWCSDPWSIAKAYQSTIGQNTSAKDTDASGLLSIIINDTTFTDKLQHPVQRGIDPENNIYYKARTTRNDILHSPKMKLDEAKMLEYIDLFSDVLKDIKGLLEKEKAMRAYKALRQLKSDDLNISSEDENKIRKLRENAINDIEVEKQNALTAIKEAADQAKGEILDEKIKSNVSNVVSKPVEESDYEKTKSDFVKDLISFNKRHHSTIPVSPLFDFRAADLVEFYVIPKLKYLDVHGHLSDINHHRKKKLAVHSLKDIFYTQNSTSVNEIYMIADAGLGKTAFCKFLVVSWCYAYETEQKKSSFLDLADSSETMREFKFLFFISLRNATDTDVHIDDMIEKQVCFSLAGNCSYSSKFMQRILAEERCLIIVDGLDEWKCSFPDEKAIPDRRSRPNCTILTTTRTWKFSTLQLKPHEIQKKILLSGLDESSRKKMAAIIISSLDSTNIDYKTFWNEIEWRSLEDFAQNPLIYMSLICLWIEEKTLGTTISQIYSSLLDVLISRYEQRTRETLGSNADEKTIQQSHLSKFYTENQNCKKYKHFIDSLLTLAAETLLTKSKQNSLVFDEQVTCKHLSNDCLAFALGIGVLTKLEVPVKLIRKPLAMYSFLHKTFQEFLAALSLCSTEKFPSVCDSLESILDQSNVFIFVSGLSGKVIKIFSQRIKSVVSKDLVVQKYRQEALSSSYIRYYRKLMIKHQEMIICCMKELQPKEQTFCTIEDFIITESFTNSQNIHYLKSLLASSIAENTVRSLTIDNLMSMGNINDIVEQFNLGQIHSLERLDFWGISDFGDFSAMMSKSEYSLKCLTIHFNKSNEDGVFTLLSSSTLLHMKNMQSLGSLSLWYVRLSHLDLKELLTFISQKTDMSYIGLQDVRCDDCSSCEGFRFDLSRHGKLEILNIGHIPLKEIQINTVTLKECRLVEFPFRNVLPSILRCLPFAENLEIFVCHFLTYPKEINDVMQLLPNLKKLKMIRFYGMNMETLECILPQSLQNMELLQLFRVTLSDLALKKIIEDIRKFSQTVEIELHDCSVIPSDAMGEILEYIKQSSDHEVITNNTDELVFRKIQSH